MQSCLCTAQVRCDVVSFGTISVRYVQLVMKNLVHASRPFFFAILGHLTWQLKKVVFGKKFEFLT